LRPGKSILETGIVPLATTPVTTSWDGSRLTLAAGASAVTNNAPNGSAIFTAINLATMNNAGQLQVIATGTRDTLSLNPYTETPDFLIQNWKAQPISAVNLSPQPETPVEIQLVGPGQKGIQPLKLAIDGATLPVPSGACAAAMLPPLAMQLVMQANSGEKSTVAMIGGPTDQGGNNALVFGLNFPSTTLAGTASEPQPGYYMTTTRNTIYYTINWGQSGLLFCANLSSALANIETALVLGLRRL
jgi:hypothetical protein